MNVEDREILPIMRAALERGQHLRINVRGHSMIPFIHDGDTIELEPLLRMPRLGEIVQVEREGPRAVVHRVVRTDRDTFYLRGDAQTCLEGPYTIDAVLGKVTSCQHGRRTRTLDRGMWRLAGLVWSRNAWLLNRLLRLWLRLFQRGRRTRLPVARVSGE